MHWDHASQQGIEVSWPLVGRSLVREDQTPDIVTVAQYHSSARTFNPQRWNASSLAGLARSAGAQYVVLTARHHSGYAMFHTRVSDFSIETSPYHADITGEFVDAVRSAGLKVGLYYSLSDWHHPDYPPFQETDKPYAYEHYRRPSPESWSRYIEYVRAQLTELLTQYGPIDLVWFDGQWERTAEEWHAAELRDLVRSLQPTAIVNDRLPGQGDYDTPEQFFPLQLPSRSWELCMTMNDSWGWRPTDANYKSPHLLARTLADVVSLGGNLLLNVSPTGKGDIPAVQSSILNELGTWIATHRDSLIGVVPPPPAVAFHGPATMKGNRLYLHLIDRPVESVLVRGIPVRRVRGVSLVATKSPLRYEVPMAALDEHLLGPDLLGELLIDAPAPSGALIDTIVIEFDGPLSAQATDWHSTQDDSARLRR